MHPLESYLRAVREIRESGAGVAETSYYPALSALLNEVGAALRPGVRCIINLRNRGSGIPDGGFFTPEQLARGAEAEVLEGQLPARGALEVKGLGAEAAAVAEGEQVGRYLERYGQVLVTNLRDWVLVGRDVEGAPAVLDQP